MRRFLLAPLVLAALIAPALAALPPYYQREAELMRIIGSEQVKEALRAAPIDAIERTGGDEYRVYGGKCAVMVRIKDLPLPEGMVGARRFELDVGKAECTN